jgi:formylglycine-generating enzyme required for sulfatase activity
MSRLVLLLSGCLLGSALTGCGGDSFTPSQTPPGETPGSDASVDTGADVAPDADTSVDPEVSSEPEAKPEAGDEAETAADAFEAGDARPEAADAADAPLGDGGPALGGPCSTAGELDCAGHAQKLMLLCDGTKWVSNGVCPDQKLCDTSPDPKKGSCQDPIPACIGQKPGAYVCDGADRHQCGPDLVTSTKVTCKSPKLCQLAKQLTCAECEDGEHACAGAELRVCAPDHMSFVHKEDCATTVLCNAGAGACTSATCLPGQYRCDGDALQKCNAGQDGWDPVSACEPGLCDAQGKQCDLCAPGALACKDASTSQTCAADGQMWVSAPCVSPTPVCLGKGVCVACSPGAKQCKGLTPQTCDGTGAWQDGTACPFVCSGGACVGACVPGSKQCAGTVPQTCDATGTWQSGFGCTPPTPVCLGPGNCVACNPGEKKCIGNVPQTCNPSGSWQADAPCAAPTPVCLGQGKCVACNPGAKQCNGNVPQTCDGTGAWQNGAACSGATPVCLGPGNCVACNPGAKQCSGNTPQTCDGNGAWQNGTACSGGTPVCLGPGTCVACNPGAKTCFGNVPHTCSAGGSWQPGTACGGATGVCIAGACAVPSCVGLPVNCGANGTSNCCGSPNVAGGTFRRSYDAVYYTDQSFPATVDSFYLDAYEVTVGRFRNFVNAGYGTQASPPAVGAGAHPKVPMSGWQQSWNGYLPTDPAALRAALRCDDNYQTWSDTPFGNENRPINCLTWYEAFAFCAWDGARLPTEAEWNYAAAGGSQQRVYPWSNPSTSTTLNASYASYLQGAPELCFGDGINGCALTDLVNAGSKPNGYGLWGQAEMAGNVWEWTLDYIVTPYVMPCNNCAYLTATQGRVVRGGAFSFDSGSLRASARDFGNPVSRVAFFGARCARSP